MTNGPVRTVAAVHDLSGVGRCALTVAIPVISAMGAQVCPAITAALSAHTEFKDVEMIDLTDFLGRALAAWERMGLKFDAVYTGYLGSPRQVDLISRFMDSQPQALKIVDPVMGDEGRLYSAIDASMAEAMGKLCKKAHVVTPNMTEYAYLVGEEYSMRPRTAAEIEAMLFRLDAPSAVITSVPYGDSMVNACRDDQGCVHLLPYKRMNRRYPGTGDLFASVLCGALVGGDSLPRAVGRAAEYVSHTIEVSMDIDIPSNFGVQLERTLPMLLRGEI